MKRLSDNAIEIVNELHTEKLAYESEYVPIIDALNRLAEYEDIGLEPEKIVFLKNVVDDAFSDKPVFTEHIRELLRTEKDGRLVVLPCKVGDNVYRLWGCGKHGKSIAEFEVTQISWYDFGIDIAYRKRNSTTGSYYHSKPDDFGKTVFLTREEAERELNEAWNHRTGEEDKHETD